jgi:hypothetical protein
MGFGDGAAVVLGARALAGAGAHAAALVCVDPPRLTQQRNDHKHNTYNDLIIIITTH